MSSSGQLSQNAAIANNVETTVFSLDLAPGVYTLKYNIALRPQEAKATYQKAWCWVNDDEKQLIASNITLPHDWPTSKEVTTQITVTADSGPILIKAMVDAADPVELLYKHDVTEKDADGNDVSKTEGCFWSIQ
jgi:hypothetical protein